MGHYSITIHYCIIIIIIENKLITQWEMSFSHKNKLKIPVNSPANPHPSTNPLVPRISISPDFLRPPPPLPPPPLPLSLEKKGWGWGVGPTWEMFSHLYPVLLWLYCILEKENVVKEHEK